MKMKRVTAIVMCLLLTAALLCSCASNAPTGGDGYYGNSGMPNMSPEFSGDSSTGSNTGTVLSDRKLIRRITMDAETEDMDALLPDLLQRISAAQGYIESRDIQNGSAYSGYRYRTATLVIRIPADKLDDFIQMVGEKSNVTATVETSQDVTLQYVDTESRLKVLRAEETRLLDFLSKASSIPEMLEIEKRLTEVQKEIESTTAQLKTYDNLVDYGTVTLRITEVKVYTPTPAEDPTIWEEMSAGFMESINGILGAGRELLVFLVSASPYLVILAIIAIIVIWQIRRRKKRRPTYPPFPPTPPPPPTV